MPGKRVAWYRVVTRYGAPKERGIERATTKIMWKYLKGVQPPRRKAPQTQDDKLCHKRQYDATDRQRTFQLTWLQQFVWLDYRPMQTGDADVIAPKSSQNPSTSAATSDGTAADDRMRMFCKTCIKYEKVGSFDVGSTVFKLESIKAHNVSSAHVKWIQKEKVKAKPGSGAVEKAMDELGKVAFERMCKM